LFGAAVFLISSGSAAFFRAEIARRQRFSRMEALTKGVHVN
jgi:hypothetical protein